VSWNLFDEKLEFVFSLQLLPLFELYFTLAFVLKLCVRFARISQYVWIVGLAEEMTVRQDFRDFELVVGHVLFLSSISNL